MVDSKLIQNLRGVRTCDGDQSLEQIARARRQTRERLVDLLETMEEHAFLPAHERGTASLRRSLEHAQAVEQQEYYFHDRTHT